MKHHDLQARMRISRRNLLIATGLGGASLFLPSLGGSRARAQSQPIRRLLIITTQHGTVPERWRMLRDNPGYGNWEYPFDDPDPMSFSEILRPLHEHRESLLVVEGLAQTTTIADRQTNNHNAGHLHALTAAMMVDDYNAGGPSVDQVIAKEVAVAGRIPSLELSTAGDLWLGGMVNLGPSQRAPLTNDAGAVFRRLFPTTQGPTMMREPTEREKIQAARRSVLDFVSDEYAAIAPRLGREDRARLDMHRELIRDLEMRIDSLASLSCDDRPSPPGYGSTNIDRGKIMGDLVAAAFACDLTRVATIQIDQLWNTEFGAPAGNVHEDFAHQQSSDPNAMEQMTKYGVANAQVMASVMTALKRYNEGDGSLLDNTAVVWTGELATGEHDLAGLPYVIGGSCGGAFRTGRYVSFAQDQPNPTPYMPERAKDSPIGPAHSHMLVSLMQAMGLPNNSIGATSVRTADSRKIEIDLTGPLPRLG